MSAPAPHHCHARGCSRACPAEHLMCRSHWRMVPERLQKLVWAAYRPGQADDKRPSARWMLAADAAIGAVAHLEGRKLRQAEQQAILALHPAFIPGVTPNTPGPDEPEGVEIAFCSTCRARVFWVVTEKGESMPMNASADDAGEWVLANPDAKPWTIRPFWPLFDAERSRYTSHFASCPYADQHRKGRKA